MRTIVRSFADILSKRLKSRLNFIQVVIGPRQVGKTTALKKIVKEWKGPSLMVTADELSTPNAHWIDLQWRKAHALGKNTLFVIDEIQKIPHWSTTVKHLFDANRNARDLKVVLLGSASLMLQKGLGESLAGRYEVISAPHWNLDECSRAFGWDLNQFLRFGGYPAAAELTSDIARWQDFIRHSIVEPVLIRDIAGLTTVVKPALFRQTFELAMAYPAQEISLQKLLGQLQDRGNVTTIKHYLELFESAFLIKVLDKYSGSKVKQKSSSPKILPLNNALIHAFENPHRIDSDSDWRGRIFEASVGAALTRSQGQLFYWREGNYEVDFVLQLNKTCYAIEVKSGRRRRFQGLEHFVHLYPKSVPLVIDQTKAELLLRAQKVDPVLTSSGF